tara:strand:- start:507 stop:857 length:351 start_codon:yes stop_codon:yes gene_type:complete
MQPHLEHNNVSGLKSEIIKAAEGFFYCLLLMNKYSYDGIFLGGLTLTITAIFELFNKNSASKIINKQGISLYINTWQLSTLNSIFYGPIIYFYVTNNFIDNYTNHNYIANIFNIVI